jgi:hypothetical protein
VLLLHLLRRQLRTEVVLGIVRKEGRRHLMGQARPGRRL